MGHFNGAGNTGRPATGQLKGAGDEFGARAGFMGHYRNLNHSQFVELTAQRIPKESVVFKNQVNQEKDESPLGNVLATAKCLNCDQVLAYGRPRSYLAVTLVASLPRKSASALPCLTQRYQPTARTSKATSTYEWLRCEVQFSTSGVNNAQTVDAFAKRWESAGVVLIVKIRLRLRI